MEEENTSENKIIIDNIYTYCYRGDLVNLKYWTDQHVHKLSSSENLWILFYIINGCCSTQRKIEMIQFFVTT